LESLFCSLSQQSVFTFLPSYSSDNNKNKGVNILDTWAGKVCFMGGARCLPVEEPRTLKVRI